MITVAIKALNEEAHIAAAIESALQAVAPFDGVVVLADSGSTDRTTEIAQNYPITILRLADPEQRCCGAGAQLAFQGVATPWFYLMDGDMVLEADFLAPGLAYLQANPGCAGVGGRVIETVLANAEFRIRNAAMAREPHRREGLVDRLDGGGLYRTDAIRSVGYFADANLVSYEEFELAARLHAAGWSLARIDRPAVSHAGYTEGGYTLMYRRFVSRRMDGAGAVLRAALARPHFGRVLRRLAPLRVTAIVALWWVLLVAAMWSGQDGLVVALLVVPLAFLTLRRGSLALGVYSFCQWNLTALGTLRGLLVPQRNPANGIAATLLKRAPTPVGMMSAPAES